MECYMETKGSVFYETNIVLTVPKFEQFWHGHCIFVSASVVCSPSSLLLRRRYDVVALFRRCVVASLRRCVVASLRRCVCRC